MTRLLKFYNQPPYAPVIFNPDQVVRVGLTPEGGAVCVSLTDHSVVTISPNDDEAVEDTLQRVYDRIRGMEHAGT